MHRRTARSLLPLLGVFALSLLSCGREVTGPEDGATRPARSRFAYLAVDPQFPSALVQTPGASSAVPFEKVRVVLRREDGSIALDTLVDFPVGASEVSLTLQVPIPTTAPASGLPLALNLNYINAAGQTVFSGGPINITATPSGSGTGGGNTPTPVSIPISYTGPGSGAVAVRISPKTGLATAGGTVTFSAEALDAAGAVIPNTPVIFSTPDPTRIQILSPTTGQVRFLAERGVGRIIASLLTGPSDQAAFDITLPASRITLASGNSQKANAGAALPLPVAVRVSAADDVAVADVPVTFSVVSGGGSVTTTTVTTNASGIATTSWRLGSTVGTQSLQATSTGLLGSPVSFTASAIGTTPTKLVFSAAPISGTAAQSLPSISVEAQDEAGNLITAFTGEVTLGLGANPSTATLTGSRTVKAVAGLATFADLKLDKAGTGFTLVATSGALAAATSAPFNIVAGSAAKLAFAQQPADTTTAGSALAPAVAVRIEDATGNLATSFTGPVSLRLIGGTPNTPVAGVTSVNAVAGIATFPGLSIARVGASYALVAEAAGIGSATSRTFVIRPAAPKTLALTAGGSQTGSPGVALAPITVLVLDQFENPVANTPVSFTVLTGGGTTAPSNSVTTSIASSTAALGTATTLWTLGNSLGTQTLRASLTADPSVNFTVSANAVPGAAARIVIATEPATSQIAGASVTPAIVAAVKDAGGFTVTSFTGSVSLAIVGGPSGATLTGTSTVNAVAGVATFTDARIPKAGSGYRLEVGSSALVPDTSIAFSVTPGAASTITKATPSNDGQSGLVNTALPLPYRVQVTDAFGNAVSGVTINWSVASGGGSIAPTSVTDANGIAAAILTLPGAPAAVIVNAAAAGLSGSPLAFTATAQSGAAASFIFATAPAASYTAGVSSGTIVLQAKDAQSNLASSFTGEVSVAIASGPTGASIGGSTVVAALAGIATFSDLTFTKAGSYTLRFSSGTLPTLTSAAITVSPAAPAMMSIAAGNGQTAQVGQPLATPLQVLVTDTFGNPISGHTVSFAVGSGGGSLSGTTSTDASGIALTIWTLGGTVGAQTVAASSAGLGGSPLTFTATATAGAAAALTMSTQPSASQTAGAAAGAIIVAARDAAGNIATSFTGAITMSILTGPPGAMILGTAVQNATNGELNFGNIAFNKTGSYVLQFTSPGLTSVNSASFSVSNTSGDTVAVVAGNAQTGIAGQPLATPLQVRVVDRYGNAVPGHNVTFAVASGGGAVSTAPVTDANGRTSANWTLGTTVGAQSVTATADFFLNGSPITFTATATATTANRIWTGAESQDWNSAANWSPAIVPAPTDSVLIPSGTTNSAVLPTSSVAIRHLRMESSTTLAMSNNDLTVAGDVEAATITGTGTVILTGATTGTVRGTMPALRVSSAGSYSVSGPLSIGGTLILTAGSLELGAQSVTVGDDLEVGALGVLRMTGAGSLAVNGDAAFAGLNAAGTLTNGLLSLKGNFIQSGSAQSFQPSGAHTVRLTGTTPQSIVFSAPDSALAATCAASCFATLETAKSVGDGGVIFNSAAKATGTLSIGGDSVSAAGRRLIGNTVALTSTVVRARNVGWGSSISRSGGTFAVDTLTAWGTNVTLPLSENLPTIVTGTANTAARHYHSIIVDGTSATLSVTAKDTIFQQLITRNGGRLAMQQAGDTLIVMGNATFNGGSTAGLLTAGRLDLHGAFTQGGAADAFHADPAHSTWLRGSSNQSVFFANPGDSHFGNFYLSQGGGAAVLESDVEVDGELETGMTAGHQLTATSLRTLRSRGADVRDLRFSNVRWELRDGSSANVIEDVVFETMPTTTTQFDIERSSGAITLNGITFQTVPTTGKYLRVADSNGATDGALAVTAARPSPSNHGGFVDVVSPATLTGWPGILSLIWQGSTSSDWNTASNWSPAFVPGVADSVVIPSGRTNYPILSSNTQIKHLAVGANASLNFANGANLGVLTSMINAPSANIGLGGLINLQGAGAKTVQGAAGTLYINGAVTATGPVMTSGDLRIFANGSLTVNGQSIIVANQLFVGFGALLRMTNSADTVLIGTHATWGADAQNSTGQMTAGFLRIGGNFTATGSGFSPSGTHRTEFNSSANSQTMAWTTPGSGQFHHLTFRGGGTKTMPAESRVTGDILIAATVTSQITSGGGHVYWSGNSFVDSTTIANGAWGATATTVNGTPTVFPRRMQSFLKVAGALQLTDSLRVVGPMDVSGSLNVNGRKLVAEQSFTTWGTGSVTMASTAGTDSLIVLGDALFQGGASNLTKGRSIFGGAFRQCPNAGDCGSTAAFAASGEHTTVLNRTAARDSVVAFGNPTASFFNDLHLATGLTIRLESDVKVAGTLSRSATLPVPVPVKSDTLILPLMTVSGIEGDITYPINFTSVRLKLIDGTANVRAQKLHFTGFPNPFTGTVFEISRTTPGGVTIEDVVFTAVNLGGGGKYIRNNGNGNSNPTGTCRNPLSSGAACP